MGDPVAAVEAFLGKGSVIRTRLRERTVDEVIDLLPVDHPAIPGVSAGERVDAEVLAYAADQGLLMDSVCRADVGRYKVEAVGDTLQTYASGVYTALPVPVTAESARTACTQADVLLCCVDNNAARLATAMLAARYHKVLLDVGTGIALSTSATQTPPHDDRIMGADVRLVLPGDGCLLCWGSLTNVDQAVDDLLHPRPLEALPAWHTQRAGSLHTLNQLAAALAIQLLQDLVVERVQTSLWAHLTVDPHGRVQVQYPSPVPPRATPCRLCASAGLGDIRIG